MEAYLAAQLCATQLMRVSWPPWSGWPLEALWRAACAMLVLVLEETGELEGLVTV